MIVEKSIKIISNRKITSDTYLMELESAELAKESGPGQFVMVKVGDSTDPLLRRPFSISDADKNGTVKILYRIVGKGTKILSNKKRGEFLSILGPLGSEFKFPNSGQKAVLIAGGIGIAPIFFLGQSLKPGNFDFLVGFKTFEEIIKVEDISGKQNFNVSMATDDGSFGYKGRVTDLLEETLKQYQKHPDIIYACGPLPMLKQAALTARKHDISCQVSIETFMACGLGVCQGCAVKVTASESGTGYQRACKEGPVFDANELEWASL
ncbi:dihydroorotate dehydrogenase electron transfer subunit [Thermodesulfobacteriota bacterium]